MSQAQFFQTPTTFQAPINDNIIILIKLINFRPRKFGIAETGKSILEEQLSQGKNREQESSGL